MLVGEIDVTIKAGDGGKGVVSFGRMRGSGPDGGNGGDGGDVYIQVSSDLTLLDQFSFNSTIAAQDGGAGAKDKMAGKRGEDLVIQLPVGSRLVDKDTGQVLEFNKVGERVFFLKGGQGGVGNFDLRSSTNTTPMTTIPARPGRARRLQITLRFIADYGLVGIPSAGKSSLLNELTNAQAKVGSYHFTTLSPNLGVLPNKKIIADIPGLIEGASDGKGLGIKFLKHIQKVSLLLHCIGVDSQDPIGDYKIVRKELEKFDKELLEKEEVILLTKVDLVTDKDLKKTVTKLKKLKRKIVPVSIHSLEMIESLSDMLV